MAINAELKRHLNGDGVPGLFGTRTTEFGLGTIIDAMHTELGGSIDGSTVTADAIVVDDAVGDLKVGGSLAVDPTASTAVTGSTETITNFDNTVTIPANSLAVGDRVRIRAVELHTATTGSETLVLTVRAGTTSLGASGNIDPVANDMWFVDYEFVVRAIGSSGELVGAGTVTSGTRGGATVVRHLIGTGTTSASHVAVDTTAAIVLAVAITHQGSATDANSTRMDSIAVDVFPA